MSNQTHQIFLIDLSKQFSFEIDDDKKNELCFSETLIISCVHCEGHLDNASTESDWSCTDSDDIKRNTKDIPTIIKTVDHFQDNSDKTVQAEVDNNFDFYFFPDCKLPIVNDSRNSILVQDGLPILNPSKRKDCACLVGTVKVCTCNKTPCNCGPKLLVDCDCAERDKNICRKPENCFCTWDCENKKADVSASISHESSGTPTCSCKECSCIALPNASGTDPERCKCCAICECPKPCYCDKVAPELQPVSCTCSETEINNADERHPQHKGINKLKRKRAGKHGYRWCHEVDPKHTYFDYAYGRHDKIECKKQEEEKIKILGLHEDLEQECRCNIEEEEDEIQSLRSKMKVRQPSLDCCSALGGINISVAALGEHQDKFLIQVVSHSSKEGAKCGSKLVSIVDRNLHTLEENRSEHISRNDVLKQRRSYISICENGYYNKITRICGERSLMKRKYHSFEDARNFLLEGANIVLLRYFAISRYKGHIKTDTVIMNGTVCENVYVCVGTSQAIVNGTPLFIAKVERHIIEPSGYIHQSLTVLTLKGYIVSHEWADSTYIFHVNPLLRVIPEKNEIESHEPLREKWRSDLQLLSDYLDFKSARTSEGARYVSENGDLSGLIRDYLQALLLLRPQDALNFTREYFETALSDLDLPHNEFFEPHRTVRYCFFED